MKTFIVILCLAIVAGCTSTKPYCPTYAENAFYPTLIPVVPNGYDTIVSVMGDTTLLPIPYVPTKGERIVVNTMLSLIGTTIVIAIVAQEQ